jgi:hypothetical protein
VLAGEVVLVGINVALVDNIELDRVVLTVKGVDVTNVSVNRGDSQLTTSVARKNVIENIFIIDRIRLILFPQLFQ